MDVWIRYVCMNIGKVNMDVYTYMDNAGIVNYSISSTHFKINPRICCWVYFREFVLHLAPDDLHVDRGRTAAVRSWSHLRAAAPAFRQPSPARVPPSEQLGAAALAPRCSGTRMTEKVPAGQARAPGTRPGHSPRLDRLGGAAPRPPPPRELRPRFSCENTC